MKSQRSDTLFLILQRKAAKFRSSRPAGQPGVNENRALGVVAELEEPPEDGYNAVGPASMGATDMDEYRTSHSNTNSESESDTSSSRQTSKGGTDMASNGDDRAVVLWDSGLAKEAERYATASFFLLLCSSSIRPSRPFEEVTRLGQSTALVLASCGPSPRMDMVIRNRF